LIPFLLLVIVVLLFDALSFSLHLPALGGLSSSSSSSSSPPSSSSLCCFLFSFSPFISS